MNGSDRGNLGGVMKLVKLDGLKAVLERARFRPITPRRPAGESPFLNAVPSKLAKGVLLFNAVLFSLNALLIMAAPGFFHQMATGGSLTTSSAFIEARAIFGGMGFGVGLWFWYCLRGRVREGLRGTLFIYGSILAGRILGFLADGNPTAHMWLFGAVEAAVFTTAAYAWRSWSAAEARLHASVLAEIENRPVGQGQPR